MRLRSAELDPKIRQARQERRPTYHTAAGTEDQHTNTLAVGNDWHETQWRTAT
jgi:hypothetical protein